MRLFPVASLLALAAPLVAQTPTPLDTTVVVQAYARPIWVGYAPGDTTRLFVVEQKQCDIEISVNGVKNAVPFLDLTATNAPNGAFDVLTQGNERGLLGFCFDPDYQNNGFFYVDYTRGADGATIVERYTAIDADNADPNSGLVIFGPVSDPQDNHNGGNVAFGPDGKLYIGLGDGGNANDTGTGHVAGGNAQATGQTWGKMHRINSDGSIPSDNPFFGNGAYVQSIWAIGVRNPWRWAFDRDTGDLWIGDVGQNAIEEINFEPAGAGGRNYGWRCMEGFSCTGLSGCVCNAVALTKPVHDYTHAGGKCSVTGGILYRGNALPDWNGTYWFGDYCTGQIWSLAWNGVSASVTERTAELDTGAGGATVSQLTSFGEGLDGEMFMAFQGGKIIKMVPEGPFTGLGSALAGTNGKPVLWGEGTLVTGSAGALNIKSVIPSATGALFVSLTEGAAPFKGGVLVTVPMIAMLTIGVDGTGAIQLAWPSWPAMPAATTLVFQAAFNDAGAVKGVSLTNGLRAITP